MHFYVSNRRLPAGRVLALASALSTCFIPFSIAHAQEDKSLPSVVVTASRVAQLQSEALPHTTVITAEDIRNSQAPDLPSLLRREASIQLTQNGGVGSSGGIFMRGMDTRQTLVLVDGVPLNKQDATGSVSLEHIMLSQVERIEIVRGNVSAIYGSGAVGGVVQVFTRRGDGKPEASLTAEAGSRGTFRTTADVSGKAESTRYSLTASRYKTDGYSAINTRQIPNANPDSDGYDNVSVAGSLSQEVAKGHELGLRFQSVNASFGFDSPFYAPADIQTGKTTDQTITLFSKNRISTDWLSSLSFSDSRSRNGNVYRSMFGTTRDHYTTRNEQFLWTNEYNLNKNVLLTGGVEHQNQSVDVNDGWGGLYDKSRDANAAFGGLQGKFGAHQFQLNARYDDVGHVGSETTGYAGYGYAVTESFKLIASTSTAFTAPPLGYLYAPFYGNPDLKPERARSVEAGAQYAFAGQLLRATLFSTRTKDLLYYDFATSKFGNVGRARNEGLEVSYAGKVADISLHGSLTLQDPQDEDTDERLSRRARTLFSLAASRDFGRWRVGGDMQYTGDRHDGEERLGSYAVFNFNLRYQATRDVSLFGRIENVVDREYQTAYGYDMPPRGIFAGVNLKL